MAVEHRADAPPGGHRGDDGFDDFGVRLASRLRLAVEAVEGGRVRVELLDAERGERIRDEIEDLVGSLDCPARRGRQVRRDLDTSPDDRERAAAKRRLGSLGYG
jgi:hypothetical protein